MPSPIGLLMALPAEGRAILGRGRWRRGNGGLVRASRLRDGTGLLCACPGAGPGSALPAARWLVAEGAAFLYGMGVAGGLHPSLSAGDVVVPDAVVEGDGGGDLFCADRDKACLVRAVLAAGGQAPARGTLLSLREAATEARAKASLFAKTGAVAADMESASLARAASEAGIPFLIVRAVCDPWDRSIPRVLAECLDEGGRPGLPALSRRLLADRSLLPHAIRLGRDFLAALASLRRAWKSQVETGLPCRLVAGGRAGAPRAGEREGS